MEELLPVVAPVVVADLGGLDPQRAERVSELAAQRLHPRKDGALLRVALFVLRQIDRQKRLAVLRAERLLHIVGGDGFVRQQRVEVGRVLNRAAAYARAVQHAADRLQPHCGGVYFQFGKRHTVMLPFHRSRRGRIRRRSRCPAPRWGWRRRGISARAA